MEVTWKDTLKFKSVTVWYRECFVMLMESITVLDGINGNHLIPPAIDVFQPEQQTVTHLMKFLLIR